MEYVVKKALRVKRDTDNRNWGMSITLISVSLLNAGEPYKYREKLLVIDPNKATMLERHDRYSEIWIADQPFNYFLEDAVGNIVEHQAKSCTHVFIEKGRKHQILNYSNSDIYIFEMQIGEINESDKERF